MATRTLPSARISRPAGGWDLWAWFFMRASALLMVVLVLGHLYIMHVINTTDTITFRFVQQRFTNPLWRLYDLLILFLALSHGLVGMRGLIEDYVHRRGWKVAAVVALWGVGFAFLVLGALVLFTFQPGAVR